MIVPVTFWLFHDFHQYRNRSQQRAARDNKFQYRDHDRAFVPLVVFQSVQVQSQIGAGTVPNSGNAADINFLNAGPVSQIKNQRRAPFYRGAAPSGGCRGGDDDAALTARDERPSESFCRGLPCTEHTKGGSTSKETSNAQLFRALHKCAALISVGFAKQSGRLKPPSNWRHVSAVQFARLLMKSPASAIPPLNHCWSF